MVVKQPELIVLRAYDSETPSQTVKRRIRKLVELREDTQVELRINLSPFEIFLSLIMCYPIL